VIHSRMTLTALTDRASRAVVLLEAGKPAAALRVLKPAAILARQTVAGRCQRDGYCAHGHKYTPANTITDRGYRECRQCRKDRAAEYRDRNPRSEYRSGKGKPYCKRGHEFTTENTYISPAGYRQCRQCMRERGARQYEALKARAGHG